MPFRKLRHTGRERLFLALAMALLAALISSQRWGYTIDQAFYDAAISQWRQPLLPNIVVVAIDEHSLLELGRWPWPRSVHAQLLNKLTQAGVKAVAFDVVFADADQNNPLADRAFAEAIAENGNVVLLVHMEQTRAGGQVLEVMPVPEFANQAAGLGHAHVEHDVDGVFRSVFLYEGLGQAYWPHAMYRLWQLTHQADSQTPPGLTRAQPASGDPFTIVRDYYNLIPLSEPSASTQIISYADILQNKVAKSLLANKIVIIGSTAKGLGDVIATPAGPVDGVLFNASIYNSLIQQNTITPVSSTSHWLISSIAVLTLILLGGRASPRGYLLMTVAASALTLAAVLWALLSLRIWFAPLAIVLPLWIFYPLWSWRRLEQALRFLGRELQRVQAQSHPLQGSDIKRVQKQLEFAARISHISDWQLATDNGQCLTNGQPQKNEPQKDEPVQWQRVQLIIDGARRAFIVRWQEGNHSNSSLWRQALAALDNHSALPPQEVAAEIVTETILRLREANRQVDEHRAFFDECMEHLQDAVIVANHYGEVIFANARARSIFYLINNAQQNLLDCVQQLAIDGEWPVIIGELLAKPGEFYSEVRMRSGEQQYFMQLAGVQWQSEHVDTLLLSLTDITAVKESERVRTEALHFLSHDLRSPVVSILALLEHFQSQSPDVAGQPKVADVLAEIESYAKKNLTFAESFLQLARAELVGDSNFNVVDMHSVIDNALMMIRQPAKAKQIEVTVKRQMDDAWVWGDGELLERVLMNLLTNAVKYSPNASTITLRLEVDQQYVRIGVTDSGLGISAENLAKIFQRFQRVGGQAAVSGAGLGLHFVDMVTRKHGGKVSVTSELNQGSDFVVQLPIYAEDNLRA